MAIDFSDPKYHDAPIILKQQQIQADTAQAGAGAVRSMAGAGQANATTSHINTLTPLQATNIQTDVDMKRLKQRQYEWQLAHGNLPADKYNELRAKQASVSTLENLMQKHSAQYNADFANQGLATPREFMPDFVSPTNAQYDARAADMLPLVTSILGLKATQLNTPEERKLYSKYIATSGTFDKDAEERFANLNNLVQSNKSAINASMGVPAPGTRPPLASFFTPKAK